MRANMRSRPHLPPHHHAGEHPARDLIGDLFLGDRRQGAETAQRRHRVSSPSRVRHRTSSIKRSTARHAQTRTTNPLLRLFGRPTTTQWEKLPCRISASDRVGRSDPIVRCALWYSTIAERRSDSTTECGRALSQPPRDRRGPWRRQSDRSWRRPLGF